LTRKRARRRKPEPGRDDPIRTQAKALLRAAGEALEAGDASTGAAKLEAALAADPTFVEPALALARLRDDQGDDVIADALVEEAVRRGAGVVDRISSPGHGPRWWHDPATRPYMKALVARGWRLLDRDELTAATDQFRAVFELAPEEDPLEAGLFAAECALRCDQVEDALTLYARLEEQPAVCYGRALALGRKGQVQEAAVSLWLGLLLNTLVAEELLGRTAYRGRQVGDPDEADEVLGRIRDLWDDAALGLLRRLVRHPCFHEEMDQWLPLVEALDEAGNHRQATQAMAAIESFLSSSRIQSRVDEVLASPPADPGEPAGSPAPTL